MLLSHLKRSGIAALAVCAGIMAGCASSKETAGRDELTANVGRYDSAPQGVNKPRVGVPPFNVTTNGGISNNGDLNGLAADQMTTLLDQTERFKVIERAQLQGLLNEQNLEGIVKSGELAKQGQVRGVDYLLLGKVTNLRVKKEQKANGFGLANIGNVIGGADVKNKEITVTTECGVDIRLVNPTTGELLTSNFSEYKRTDSAKSMGLQVLGANAQSSASMDLSEDDKGKILRLALDDAVRKSLPKIDNFLRNQPARTADTAAPVNAPAVPVSNPPAAAAVTPTPGNGAVGAKRFCSECGTANGTESKFCAKCGHKLD